MLSLRVARGSRPTVLLRRLLVAATAAGTGFLLLAALRHAMGHPGRADGSVLRLAWCAVPFAVSAYLAVLVARTEPSGRLHTGSSAAGLDRGGLRGLGAASTALNCALGSAVALVAFQASHRPVPVAGALTLLALLPVVAAGATAVSLRPARVPAAAAGPAPGGLPWGVALIAIGVAVEFSFSASPGARPLMPLPGGLGRIAPAVVGGWALTAAGLVLAVPGLVHACGRLLAACRPGALRLLAGRALREDARRVGRPLGVLCAAASAFYSGAALHASGSRPAGPLTLLGVTLVGLGALAAALTATVEARHARRPATDALTGLGAPASLLRAAVALRTGVVIAALVPVTWAVAELAVLPLRP
ncbi:MAG: hypothetical protein QOF84_721 [Streptomyces sp.]|nr:hypothetical protein [Streptomyces sp.]